LGMNFWTTPWSIPKILWEKMTHIKDLWFHLLVFGFLKNWFFSINASFYIKSITLQRDVQKLFKVVQIEQIEGYMNKLSWDDCIFESWIFQNLIRKMSWNFENLFEKLQLLIYRYSL
jgi:hypothetical protein